MDFDILKIQNLYGFKNIKLLKDFNVKGNRIVVLIETNKAKFIVKAYKPEALESKIEKDTYAIDFLNTKLVKFAPNLIKTIYGKNYSKIKNRFFYIMEYIEGLNIEENPINFYKLGLALLELHKIKDYKVASSIDFLKVKKKMLALFSEQEFKQEYDYLLNKLPDFNMLEKSFIHTDVTCFNAKFNLKREVIFLDLDDAGMGCKYFDLGQPLITQFVRFDNDVLKFNEQNSTAFYKAYQNEYTFSDEEKELVFQGAIFMQAMQIPWFGKENEIFLWQILKFAIDNKERLILSI